MKTVVSFLLALVSIAALAGCGNTPPAVDGPPAEQTGQPSAAPELPIETAGALTGNEEKQLLELKHFTESDLGFDSADGIEIESKTVHIPLSAMVETGWTGVSSAASLDDVLDAIRADYPDLTFENWEYSIHLIADDGSWGMIRFRYKIGAHIITNKAITCSYDSGSIDKISYTNMGFALTEDEEQELIRRAEDFLNTHTQEKRVFQEGERFLEEQTVITYYYNVDKLLYSYALFFEYGVGELTLINNDYGTECLIE